MKGNTVVRLLAGTSFLTILFLAVPGRAQPGGGAGSSGSASPSPAAAPTGTGAVESAIISYEATGQVAHELAGRFCEGAPLGYSSTFLLGTPTNLSALQSALAFEEAVTQLTNQYKLLEGKPISAAGGPALFLAITPGASAAITAITGAVNDIKTQTTQTASTFTPVDQVLFSDLEREMEGKAPAITCHLITTAYPGMIKMAVASVNKMLDNLLSEQDAARKKRDGDDPKKYSDDKDLQGLDAQLSTLEQTLGNETANMSGSSILLGEALLGALGDKYHVITLANAAAGGGTRANVYFLVNILFPAPHPSYNGGSAVAYTLRTGNGVYESADMVYFIYGYTKWHQPKFAPIKGTKGFSSFGWTPPVSEKR
jgi:hypothetical protein